MATRTTAALACSLAILFVLTRATGQPLTVPSSRPAPAKTLLLLWPPVQVVPFSAAG
jgi:hypothetical protein